MTDEPLEGEVDFNPREISLHDPYIIPPDFELENEVTRPRWWYVHQLRLAGASWDDCARAIGYADGTKAEQAVRRHRKPELLDLKHLIQDELDRLDMLQFTHWRRARQGDIASSKVVLDIMAMRHKILGIGDKGAIVKEDGESRVVIGGTEEDYIRSLNKVIEQEAEATA